MNSYWLSSIVWIALAAIVYAASHKWSRKQPDLLIAQKQMLYLMLWILPIIALAAIVSGFFITSDSYRDFLKSIEQLCVVTFGVFYMSYRSKSRELLERQKSRSN